MFHSYFLYIIEYVSDWEFMKNNRGQLVKMVKKSVLDVKTKTLILLKGKKKKLKTVFEICIWNIIT